MSCFPSLGHICSAGYRNKSPQGSCWVRGRQGPHFSEPSPVCRCSDPGVYGSSGGEGTAEGGRLWKKISWASEIPSAACEELKSCKDEGSLTVRTWQPRLLLGRRALSSRHRTRTPCVTLDLPVATLRWKQKQVKFILLLFSPVSPKCNHFNMEPL